ncbi:aldo/keto reductase [[Clostridium] symbiosum]|uniref:aldo/keto reductase n=1 Tax=Clostridium symbiosum TaxID=1512 RepID=UPI001D0973C7|nr:aldo/keto reductase [[Clostridium] symbiosum]MCB6608281.1 aldo/keto reductase [[Clostridium] symbiosum]MCB6932831.1 aldo/keto reductase [[Clostridium] symbiosum]
MEYTYLGRTGLKVSRFCLGTMNFGTSTEEKDAFYIMDKALDAGINFFDTADAYGGFAGEGEHGLTEKIIGRWFAQEGGRRDRVILATKVFATMEDPFEGPNDEDGLSAWKVRRHMEDSLKRLQTDHIDLYYMHHIDRHVTWPEMWGAMEPLVNTGKATYIASSNFAAHDLVRAQWEADKRHFLGLVAEQHQYHLLSRLPELEVIPAARELGLGLVTYSPLAGGMLGENALKRLSGSRSENRHYSEEMVKTLTDFAGFCHDLGEKQSDVAMAWILKNPVVTSPLIGPRTPEHLDNIIHALDVKLDDSAMKRLDEIFPGPGGEAPDSYAW